METALIVNAGSSSVKFRLYEGDAEVLDGMVDRIGPRAVLSCNGKRRKGGIHTYTQAAAAILDLLEGKEPDLIVHRVVHGGTRNAPMRITRSGMPALRRLIPLAPLHMPKSLEIIAFFLKETGARQVACFDTAFHRTMPAVARTYAIPRRFAQRYGIVRYGFHGIAHGALAAEAARRMRKPLSRLNLVTCQLGNGASVCAIRRGKSVDTTMGYTPLEGLVMGTRSGSIDPAIPLLLAGYTRETPQEVMRILERESGLLAIAGSNDVRDLLGRKDARARLALDLFAYHVRKAIGSYFAVLGRVDAIVLGGGIAQSPVMRRKMLSGMEGLGIALDARAIGRGAPVRFSKGRVQVWALEADEQAAMLTMARSLR